MAQEKSLFQILEERNKANVELRSPTIIGSASDIVSNSLAIIGSSFEAMAKGLELGNGYITEELDRMVGYRTTAKVDATMEQLQAIGKLVALGATVEEATTLATSYRR